MNILRQGTAGFWAVAQRPTRRRGSPRGQATGTTGKVEVKTLTGLPPIILHGGETQICRTL
jgi:hypothetical protein